MHKGGQQFIKYCLFEILCLNDIKELILLAESPQESLIYMSSAIKIFGEKGKKFISLLSE